jgi:hypothetical protein
MDEFSKQDTGLLLGSADPLTERLNTRLEEIRAQRAINCPTLGTSELEDISKLEHRLFPVDFELDKQQTEDLRALCSLSQTGLRQNLKITSHRPLIGPLIVFGKRILWRIVQVLLKETFAGTQEFNARLVKSHAKALLRIDRLEKLKLSNATRQVLPNNKDFRLRSEEH